MVFQPITISAGQNPLVQFDGLVTTYFLEEPAGTAFQIKQVYKPLPKGPRAQHVKGAYRGPPPHFHPNQTERFRVLKGRVGVEIDGDVRILRPEDGVAVCPAGRIHRFIVDVDDSHEDAARVRSKSNGYCSEEEADEDEDELVLLINATDAATDFALDRIFLENWYGLRVDSFKYYGDRIDFIQKCATFDGGAHYLPFPATLPAWVPKDWSEWIRTFLGYWITVLIGRWIGGLLGYKPFYREYTTDWEFAMAKMRSTWFYRRNLHYAYKARTPSTVLEKMKPWSDYGAAMMVKEANAKREDC
ncbi:hypothetical protein B0J12DRAFT_771487 [Macrophomina phaseolina]|uniref:Cupin type-2 domain-containing protein n=1 Tax=Macrophomina phaseolina TaxID=35725 RepID=A0ABQ8FTX4_9PEZI|nr:hypothetical protein B0J12DRAFT_771487 [Macrophomina phaseolina]